MPVRHDDARAALMQGIAGAARAALGAVAASVSLLDEDTDELVFVGVSGAGQDDLLGARFPAGEGLAGEVLRSGGFLEVADTSADPRFARDIATETGHVPDAVAAIALAGPGVLMVLDPQQPAEQVLAALAVHAEAGLALLDAELGS